MNENNILSNIPQTLKELSRWILWRLERRDGTETKVPYRIDGVRASATNPNDWTDFATACRDFNPEKYNGLGFVLRKEDNIVCIDLDNCIGDDGKICDEAKSIVRMMNSWTEISQSGKGLHIFIRGKKPTDKSKATPRSFKSLEIYDHARYIALTGNHLQGTPLTIEHRQTGLNALYVLYFPERESTPAQSFKPHHDSLTDDEIIALCRKAQNAPKFVALYDNGDTSLYNGDESRADEALACMLAFYTKDAAQLERLMNASALARREKWRQREDYRRRTIQKALSLTREHYDAKPKSTMNLDSYPLTKINATVPENDLDDELDESGQTYDLAIPELPNGLFRQVYDYLAAFDVPRAFALTGATALIATILGDRIGFYFDDENEEENEEENEDGMIFANDFFIQIGRSSSGKSTTSRKVRSLLRTIDKKILKPDSKRSELLYKNASTARGLIDQIRHESDAERIRREADERAAEKSGKAPPPKRTPQTSGLWLLDEFVQLLESFNSEFNAELCSIILSLWDNTEFSRQTKSDGAIDVPQTSITILGNSVPETFWQALPANASRRGFLQRLLIVATNESRRKTMLQVKYTKKKVSRKVLCKDLLDFFCYCAKRPPVNFLPEECVPVEIEFRNRYQSSDIDIQAFLDRLNVRLLKFSMIVATCKAFETRAPEIVIDARTMEQAGALLDFFIRSTINFIKVMSLDGQKPIDALGKTKTRMLSLLRDKFQGEVKQKILRDYLKVGNQLFEKALAELKESGKVKVEERKVRGQKSDIVTLTAKFSSPFLTSPCNGHNRNSTETQPAEKLGKKGEETLSSPFSSPSSPFDINSTVTQPQPQKGEKGEEKKGEEPTVPGPSNPEPMPAPEPETEPTVPGPTVPEPVNPEPMPVPPEPEPPQPMPVVEPETEPTIAANPVAKPESLLLANACEIARSLCAEFTENEFRREAMLFHGATPQTAKQMIYALLKEGYLVRHEHIFVRTEKLYAPEPQAKPLQAPEPKPEPEPTFVEPETTLNAAPQANAHDLANLVLSHLEKFWHCRKIPGESLRRIITTNCGKQANAVWKLLFPAHIVKLHTTDFFIFRDHKLRPKGFDGLIDYEGVLPSDEPALF
jgi:hypothetical protein